MSILAYIPGDNPSGKYFLAQIEDLLEEDRVELIDNLSGFAARLKQPLGTAEVAVLLPPSEQSLMNLLELYQDKLMYNLRLVVVLPALEDDLLRIAYQMYPRYITDSQDGFAGIKDVLVNLVGTAKSTNAGTNPATQSSLAARTQGHFR